MDGFKPSTLYAHTGEPGKPSPGGRFDAPAALSKSAISLVAIHSHYRRARLLIVVEDPRKTAQVILTYGMPQKLNGHPPFGCPLSYVSTLVLQAIADYLTKINRLQPQLNVYYRQ
jgi:hypothetical protein